VVGRLSRNSVRASNIFKAPQFRTHLAEDVEFLEFKCPSTKPTHPKVLNFSCKVQQKLKSFSILKEVRGFITCLILFDPTILKF